MPRIAPAVLAALFLLPLAGCVEPGAALTGPESAAPPTPVDGRSKGLFEQITGINGDAVAAISGDARRSYIYYDLFAARKEAVAAAPARLCAHYGKAMTASHVTNPGDHVPGMKVLVVTCAP